MRCQATVENQHALSYRSTRNESDQCLREAKVGRLCRQHAAVKVCAAQGCEERAHRQEGDWWFCREHAPLWAQHNRIVDRILRIPVR